MHTKTLPWAAALIGLFIVAPVAPSAAQEGTPMPATTCQDVAAAAVAATPAGMAHGMAGMEMGTPMPEMDHMAMELDLAYIDMMIPHHASIIAMSQAALPELTDERLRAIAQAIVDSQSAEIEELRGYRETFYGEADPMPMDVSMMAALDDLMPGMSGSMKDMDFQMDAAAQVAVICEAKDTDLVFIDLTIPHHQMAIESSETVAAEASHPEIREFAQRVVEDQQREIDLLQETRASLTGSGTPERP